MIFMSFEFSFRDPRVYQYGILVVSLITAAILCLARTWQDISPRHEPGITDYIGLRSYSIYLFHWPIMIIAAQLIGRLGVAPAASSVWGAVVGIPATFIAAEASDKTRLETLLAGVLSSHGQVDIVVNGAGINSATPFLDITEDECDRILRVNYKSVFLGCQVFGKYLLGRGKGGSIINLGSMSGLIPLSRVFTYSASKAAIHNLSKNLAREWAPQGIRVNTIVPGFFPAEQNRKVLTPERVASIMGHTPMKRFGEARELIGATLLLSGDAGAFITGSEIVVDGGYHAMTI
jgi:NAD(P)-dependent dehydrogenase (short-subunit alcohol dehydrogenase family)